MLSGNLNFCYGTGQIMVPRTSKNVLVYKRHGQSCRDFCTLVTQAASLGLGGQGRRRRSGFGKAFLQQAGRCSKGRGKEEKAHTLVLALGTLTVTRRVAHDVSIQHGKASWKSTQSRAPEPRFLRTVCVSQHRECGCCSISHLSWAGLFCAAPLWPVSSIAGCGHWLPCGSPWGRGNPDLVMWRQSLYHTQQRHFLWIWNTSSFS